VADLEVPVLIVGGSLVGLSTALLLAQHGVRALAVEHHAGTAIHPRAAAATQRTVEVLRSVGLEGPVTARSAEQFVQDGGIVGVETLFGGPTAHYIANLNAGIKDVSPCERLFLSQSALEPFLRERAQHLGARLLFGTEVQSLTQDGTGVLAVLRDRDSGASTRVRAQYAVAADGARSRVRQQHGIGMRGRPAFSRSATIYFRADMKAVLADRKWAVVYVNNDRMRGFFRFEKPYESAFLAVNTLGDPAHPDTDVTHDLDEERARELVQIALGDDVPVVVEKIMHWEAAAQVAERFRDGRIFIAGDAAHVMPPTGGFGGNTGIQDAHNLAWKLALVLQGKAGDPLLDSYEQERLPTAQMTVDQAYVRYALRTDTTLKTPDLSPLVEDLRIELGYVYRSGVICSEPGEPLASGSCVAMSPRETRGLPGTRAPHLWLSRNGTRLSSLDLYGEGFVVLGGPESREWCEAAGAAARAVGVRVDAQRSGVAGLQDPGGEIPAAHGIEPDGCVLVRPDGFIAWRTRRAEGASRRQLVTVLHQALGLAAPM
jgi:2-polyprenyl-6-methoxyphenol hydroxylase-like FAD-dependent oxidoreductase